MRHFLCLIDRQGNMFLAITVVVTVGVNDDQCDKEGQDVCTKEGKPDPFDPKEQREDDDRQIGEDDLLHDRNE